MEALVAIEERSKENLMEEKAAKTSRRKSSSLSTNETSRGAKSVAIEESKEASMALDGEIDHQDNKKRKLAEQETPKRSRGRGSHTLRGLLPSPVDHAARKRKHEARIRKMVRLYILLYISFHLFTLHHPLSKPMEAQQKLGSDGPVLFS